MKPIHILCACLLLSGVARAQTSSADSDSSADNTNLATEVKALREALLQTQRQMAAQQREIETLKAQSKNAVTVPAPSELPSRGNGVASDSDVSAPGPTTLSAGANIQQQPRTRQLQEQGKPEQMPLGSFNIGDAVFTPGGFVDLENIFRTTNTQNNIATNFAAIPFSNTAQGHLSEFRTTAQYSRLNLKVTDKFGRNDVTAYIEGDFSGNDAANVYQSVNGQTNRLRL